MVTQMLRPSETTKEAALPTPKLLGATSGVVLAGRAVGKIAVGEEVVSGTLPAFVFVTGGFAGIFSTAP